MNDRLRIGLIGAGPWARNTHARALAAHPGVDFVGGWARNPTAAAEVFPRAFDTPDELFAAVDAVSFAVPPDVQADLAVRAAQAGKHLILDKPIALDVPGAVAVADAVRAAGVRSVVTFTRRFAPETRTFLTQARALSPVAAEAQWLSGAALSGAFAASAWRQEYGALFDVGPHVLDLVDAALGPIDSVDAVRYDPDSDTYSIALVHEAGAASAVSLSLRTATATVLRVAVHSAAGLAVLDSRQTTSLDCFAVLLDEFLDAIRRGVEHPLGVEHGVRIQRVIAEIAERSSGRADAASDTAEVSEVIEVTEAQIVEPEVQVPSSAEITGYTDAGVPTFDHAREAIERRTGAFIGCDGVSGGSAASQDAERAFEERARAAKAKVAEIRRSLGTPPN